MSFDTNVASPSQIEIRPPQMQSPLEAAAQFQQLRAGQQESQARAMENQQRALDLQDQQVARQAYMDSGGDMQKFQQLLMKGGASPKMVTQIQQQLLATKKTLAEADKATLENNQARHDQARGELTAFEALPDQQKAAQYPQVLQNLRQRGLLNDQEYNEWTQQNPTYPGSDAMKMGINHLATGSQLAKEEIERRNAVSSETSATARKQTADTAAQRLTAELPGITATNLTKGLQAAGQTVVSVNSQSDYDAWRQANPEAAKGLPPMFSPALKPVIERMAMTAEQRTQADQAASNAKETAHHNMVEEGQGVQRIGVERGRLAVEQQNAGVDANGRPIQYTDANGQPVNVSPLARQIAEYKMPAPAARSYSSNRGLLNQVLAINPNFDIGQYEQRYETYKDLRPGGKLGQQALALNTLIRHSDDLLDAVGSLGNGNFTPANAGYQKLRQLFGSSAPTNFDQLKQYVAGETVKLVRGGGGTQEDEHNASAQINRAGSPEQLLDALKVNFGVAGGKMQALNQAVRTSTGQKDFTALDQGATDILKRRGYDTETMKPAGQAGGGAPLLPASLTPADKGKVFLNRSGQKIKITDVHPTDGTKFKFETVGQ